jgi:hypothetical protein
MFIISKGKVEILLLHASTFNANYTTTHGHVLQEKREKMIHSSPELVKRFKESGKWMAYKKKVIEEVVMRMRKKNTNCVSYNEVPGTKRSQQSSE